MQRPALLALPVVVLSTVIVQLKTIYAYEPVRDGLGFELVALTELSRISWSLTAAVGLAAVGYAYGRRARSESRHVLGVATVAALAGVLVGNLLLWLRNDISLSGALVPGTTLFGLYSVLDALMFGLIVVGGYALTLDAHRDYRRSS